MENLTKEELIRLYMDFTIYRDVKCGGHADMTVQEYYNKVFKI